MKNGIKIKAISPTVFLKKEEGELRQLVKLGVENNADPSSAILLLKRGDSLAEMALPDLPKGESSHDIFIPEVKSKTPLELILKSGGSVVHGKRILLAPPRHWVVHVVQTSHHDVGYTDLPDRVHKGHLESLDKAIDYAESTDHYPEDEKFRITIEQAWSVDYFLKHAPADRAGKIIGLMRQGRFELTAFFANMTSELCGHEEMVRLLYPSFALKRKYGIPIVSAEHDDITGISWGLSTILTEAGIKIFLPGLPRYYTWGRSDLASFWDEKAILGKFDTGAFLWEAPSGKSVLFWNNYDCGGSPDADFSGLPERLQKLTEGGFPYSVFRHNVQGGARDNAPYIDTFAHQIRAWNSTWAYPRMVCSTNAKFYGDLAAQLPKNLRTLRGELAGQDYPVGAMSTAAATAQNRNNHAVFHSAEKFASAAALCADYPYPSETLGEANENILFYDEHTWGMGFPCGAIMDSARSQKEFYAYRAAASAHEVLRKACARIADHIDFKDDHYHLVVFNAAPHARTSAVRTPLREFRNCGSAMVYGPPENDSKKAGTWTSVLLQDRNNWHLPEEMQGGKFDLTDLSTGKNVPFQIVEIGSANDTVPYSAQRLGLGSGTRRLGILELPTAMKFDLCFIAEDVPSCGYKTYRLKPKSGNTKFKNILLCGDAKIENEYYRIAVDKKTGAVKSIYDKQAKREIVDTKSPRGFYMVVTREKNSREEFMEKGVKVHTRLKGPVCASIEVTGSNYGNPEIRHAVSLYAGIKQIHLETRILKDATPLLNVHLAFPFNLKKPKFRYEGALSAMDPITDYLPGSYSDAIAAQNWVKVTDGKYSVLWSSLDAPITELGGLWIGYTSPAHRAVFTDEVKHPPLKPEDLKKAWIFSNLFSNNFGTNFYASQVSEVLFRYVVTTVEGDASDAQASEFGWNAVLPTEQMYAKKVRDASLPPRRGFLESSNSNITALTFKKAEDGDGFILRLWNRGKKSEGAKITFGQFRITGVSRCDIAEQGPAQAITHTADGFEIVLGKNALETFRIAAEAVITPAGAAKPILHCT